MKARNLELLQLNHINVPKFFIVKNPKENIKNKLKDGCKYAVRSSSNIEDSKESSHAGQFKTFLNIDKEDVENKVQEVFNSMVDVGGRVIVQEMIDSDISGVIFTSNPIGILNETVIVAGKGLGENIVEDKIETSSYYYNLDDNMYYYNGENILSEYNIETLVYEAKKIKDIFNYPIDIEYAIKDNEVFILQTRPITTLGDCSNPIILDNSNIVESYPGISLPLTQDFVKEIYYKVFRKLVLRITTDLELVNKMDNQLRDMVDISNGRIYYNITNWYDVLNLLPFSSKIIDIWQEMLGVENKNVTFNNKVTLSTKLKVIKQFKELLKTSPVEMNKLNEKFSANISWYRTRIDNCITIEDLIETYESLMKELTDDWDITLVNDMYTFIFTKLSGKNNKKYLTNIKNLESMKPVESLNKLIYLYNKDGITDKFLELEKRHIEIYGDRCPGELKLETKTYRTNPELLREYIKNGSHTLITAHTVDTYTNRFVNKAKIGIYNREISRMNRSRIFGLAREIMIRIGEELVKKNQIQNIDDVFYLRYSELTSKEDMKQLVEDRKLEIERYTQTPNYSRLVFKDRIIDINVVKTYKSVNNSELKGIASSVGKVKGEVVVLDEARTDIDVKDKIIVTKSTDPGWVFLIKNCVGIITERGSMLSHTAIITRELNKPSVVNVKDVTKMLKTGDLVEIDGYKGEVTLIKKGD